MLLVEIFFVRVFVEKYTVKKISREVCRENLHNLRFLPHSPNQPDAQFSGKKTMENNSVIFEVI